MVCHRFRNQIMICKAHPVADLFSNHNLVVMKSRMHLKILRKTRINQRNTEKLKNSE